MTPTDPISLAIGAETGMVPIDRPDTPDKDAKEDYQSARKNISELIEQGMASVPTMLHLMNEAQSDKMYKAAAEYLKVLSGLNIQLAELSKEQIKGTPAAKEAPQVQQITQTNNITYVGTTEKLLEQRRAARKQRDGISQEDVIDVPSTPV